VGRTAENTEECAMKVVRYNRKAKLALDQVAREVPVEKLLAEFHRKLKELEKAYERRASESKTALEE